VTDAINAAKAAYGTESDANALDIIASEWLAAAPSASMSDEEKVQKAIQVAQMLESNLGVKLEVVGIANDAGAESPL